MELRFKIILENAVPGVDFALQKGSGNNYTLTQKQKSDGNDLTFEFTADSRNNKDGKPDFYGTVVQGAAGERFIYIGIGTYAGEADSPWSRRLKIPLRNISEDIISQLTADPKLILTTRVPGTGKDGTPNCATVKPFEGWYTSRE